MSVLEEFFREAKWLKKLNKCDETAFGQCYDFYAPKLYRHAFYRLGSKELAEDIVSEVFTRTWEFLVEPGNKIDNLKAFLYRIANNLIIDYYRAKGKQPILVDEILQMHLGDEGRGAEKLDSKLELELVLKNLEKLNQETQELLIWRYIDQLSISEICKVSGKTANAVYVAIHRGLKELKKLTNLQL